MSKRMNEINQKKWVMDVLHGQRPPKVPFTVYENKLPMCRGERILRNRGLCLVKRITSYRLHRPNVKVETHTYIEESGRKVEKTVYTTPYGQLSTLSEPATYTSWLHEHMFKSPADYKKIKFLIEDTVVEADYDNALQLKNELGDDFVVRDGLGLEPMQALISSAYMSMETFCIEWMDRRDEILKLYDALVDVAQKIYPVVADGPLDFANYGGNVTPQVIGVENFIKYYVPHYNKAADILHRRGKLIGSHLDADNGPIMEAISQTELDYIEAYDPGISPPVKQARMMWPEKVLWLNWPSSWHLLPPNEIKERTIGLIKEVEDLAGLIIGITEDVPQDRWQQIFFSIMDGIDAVK